jgi:hypothetical protein
MRTGIQRRDGAPLLDVRLGFGLKICDAKGRDIPQPHFADDSRIAAGFPEGAKAGAS